VSDTTQVLEREEREAGLLEKVGLYHFFSRLFAAPPSLWIIQDIVEHNLLTAAYHFHRDLEDPQRLEDEGWVKMADMIAVEFTSLFSAPGKHYLPPYESFYVNELRVEQVEDVDCGTSFQEGSWKGFIGQRSTSEVRALYEAAGLEMSPEFHDLPDHISAELDFLAHLASRQVGALERGLLEVAADYARQGDDFRSYHLDRWCPTFLGCVKANPVSHFYHRVAVALDGFLECP